MKALIVERNAPRLGAARVASALRPGAGARASLRYTDVADPAIPAEGWQRIRPLMSGICGSDLATVDGRSSLWFEPIVSFPFVPGHEVVALDEEDRRVVLEPVLGCVARGVTPLCPACADGRLGNCSNLTHGHVDAGLQTGYCCDTGGGWAPSMVAHVSQLHQVPDELDDRAAVMIEPTACAVHAALSAKVEPTDTVAIIGAGTQGLSVTAALARWSAPAHLVIAAKYPEQRRLAAELASSAADTVVTVCAPSEITRAVRRATGTSIIPADRNHPNARLGGGADVTIDCVGNAASISTAIAMTRPGGRIILVGMPGVESLDLTPLWQREISLTGAYTYGTETLAGQRYRTFDLATELVAAADLGRLVSATYPLSRYADALEHAATAGPRGAVKIAFALNDPDHPPTPILKGRR